MVGRTQYVAYIAHDGRLRGMSWASGQSPAYHDFTSLSGAAMPAATSPLAAYADAESAHLVYVDSSGDIHHVSGTAAGWQDASRWEAVTHPSVAADSPVTGHATGPTAPQVFYVGIDRHVHGLYRESATWHHDDLTDYARGPRVGAGGAVASYLVGTVQHVVYVADDSHLHELQWSPGGPTRDRDLNVLAGFQPPEPTTPLAVSIAGSQPTVVYIDRRGRVTPAVIPS